MSWVRDFLYREQKTNKEYKLTQMSRILSVTRVTTKHRNNKQK